MALFKYIQRYGLRQFSVSYQHLINKPDLYKSYKHNDKTNKIPTDVINPREQYMLEKSWNEKWQIMKHIKFHNKEKKDHMFSDFRDELFMKMQNIKRLLYYKGEIKKSIEKYLLETELISQSFLENRIELLGPDIGAAHFILNRGGRIKFLGQKDWITRTDMNEKLPKTYVPGLYVVAIDATNTRLYYEGIDCLRYLNKLKWLRLKGLKNLNDFSLDIISGRYGPQLEYLDLTGCEGITHFGLSCFYRFKCLKGLNVTGLDHTPEFQMMCLMIHDLLPDLDIIGIDFSQHLKDEKQNEPIIEIVGETNDKIIM